MYNTLHQNYMFRALLLMTLSRSTDTRFPVETTCAAIIQLYYYYFFHCLFFCTKSVCAFCVGQWRTQDLFLKIREDMTTIL